MMVDAGRRSNDARCDERASEAWAGRREERGARGYRMIWYLNLGLGTYCGFPPVGWVHITLIGYLFLMVLLVSTEATSDVGTKY